MREKLFSFVWLFFTGWVVVCALDLCALRSYGVYRTALQSTEVQGADHSPREK